MRMTPENTHLQTNSARLIARVLDRYDAVDRATAQAAAHRLAEAVELAYGLLWSMVAARPGDYDLAAAREARRALVHHLDRAGQARGIEAARKALGPMPTPY